MKWTYKQRIPSYMGVGWYLFYKDSKTIYVLYSPYDGYTSIYRTDEEFSWASLDRSLENKIPAMLSLTDNKPIPTYDEVGLYVAEFLNKLF